MGYFDERFYLREGKAVKRCKIEHKSMERLKELSFIYDASIAELINACIEYYLRPENFELIEVVGDPVYDEYPFYVRDSNWAGIEELNSKYKIGLYGLVNMAIRKVLNQYQ